jgi:hypothetical protein
MDLTTGNDEKKNPFIWINRDQVDLHVYTVKPV